MSASRKPKTVNPDEVDPSIYLYDEIYDEMKDEELKGVACENKAKDKPQGSKYIQGLLETADQRKTEKELRKFKRYARDREMAEEEGDLDEVDVFITPTYKRKLEEMQRIDEAKRRRLEHEKDKAMNFSRHRDVEEKNAKEEGNKSPDGEDSRVKVPLESTSIKIDSNLKDVHDLAQNLEPKSNNNDQKKPKTIEEKKEYLRKVLAKRTVGSVFEAAVLRYNERKANKLIF